MSGLTRIGLYRTDGAPVKKLDGAASPQTVVELDFNLSLKGLRYQQQRVVPDRSRAEDVKRQETQHLPRRRTRSPHRRPPHEQSRR